jgi:uncharacterized protein
MTTAPPRFDLPQIEDETRPWWDAAREERLLVRRCNACRKAHLYPRPFCPSCWSEDVTWEQASGRATLYTWSVVYANDLPPFAGRVPYVAAIVDLDEGPRLETNVINVDPAGLVIGMPLQVTFRHSDTLSVPLFQPA